MVQRYHRLRPFWYAVFGAALLGMVVVMVMYNMTRRSSVIDPITDIRADYEKEDQLLGRKENLTVYLYFANKENTWLTAEKRSLLYPKDSSSFGRKIVEALIEGPQGELMQTIPVGTKLRALYVTQEKTAVVDLTKAVQEDHPGGIQTEFHTIYSIVNSLVLNMPTIDKVKFLIDGREAITLAGHIDLRYPFKADMLIVQ